MILVVVVVATALVSAIMGRVVGLFSLRTTGSDVGVHETSPVTSSCDGWARGRGTTELSRWRALLEKSAYALRVG
jgi:hypothetical protein